MGGLSTQNPCKWSLDEKQRFLRAPSDEHAEQEKQKEHTQPNVAAIPDRQLQ